MVRRMRRKKVWEKRHRIFFSGQAVRLEGFCYAEFWWGAFWQATEGMVVRAHGSFSNTLVGSKLPPVFLSSINPLTFISQGLAVSLCTWLCESFYNKN